MTQEDHDDNQMEGGSGTNFDGYIRASDDSAINRRFDLRRKLNSDGPFRKSIGVVNFVLTITLTIMIALMHKQLLHQLHSLHSTSQLLDTHLNATDVTIDMAHSRLV